MLIDTPLRSVFDAFASSDPTPGGGSASALSSAVGASLLTMVAGLPKTRHNSEEDRRALHNAAVGLTELRRQLADAIDADASAYDRVVAAYKLPKGTASEQQARKAAIQRALREAIDVPLGVMRLSAQALAQGAVVAAHGNPSAASDVGVGAALVRAGAGGAFLNVEINLQGIDDQQYRDATTRETAALTEAIERARRTIESALGLE